MRSQLVQVSSTTENAENFLLLSILDLIDEDIRDCLFNDAENYEELDDDFVLQVIYVNPFTSSPKFIFPFL